MPRRSVSPLNDWAVREASPARTARILEYQNQRVLCEVESNSPGYLVLLDSYYPGWHAYVDGIEAKILPPINAFRAVGAGR